MSPTVSARIPKEMHERLRIKCNDLGCTINDYIVGSLELVLDRRTEFDFGDEEDLDDDPEDNEPSDIEPEPITRKRPELDEDKYKSHHDSYGNYLTYDEDKQMWICHINPDQVKIKS